MPNQRTGREFVGQGLELIHLSVPAKIDSILSKQVGPDWVSRFKDKYTHGKAKAEDLSFALSSLAEFLRSARGRTFNEDLKDLTFATRDIRNKHSHSETFSVEEAFAALLTLEKFCISLGVTATARELGILKKSALAQMTGKIAQKSPTPSTNRVESSSQNGATRNTERVPSANPIEKPMESRGNGKSGTVHAPKVRSESKSDVVSRAEVQDLASAARRAEQFLREQRELEKERQALIPKNLQYKREGKAKIEREIRSCDLPTLPEILGFGGIVVIAISVVLWTIHPLYAIGLCLLFMVSAVGFAFGFGLALDQDDKNKRIQNKPELLKILRDEYKDV